jgi:amino acid adenylation domain-containing protein
MDHQSHKPNRLSKDKARLFDLLLKKKGVRLPDGGQIPRRAEQGPCALSFAQQRLWYVQQLDADNPAYNISTVVSLKGPLDTSALENAFGEIVLRHESLRTTFASIDGDVRQVVSQADAPPLSKVDLSGLQPAEQEQEARRLISRTSLTPFDLAQGPLLRAALLRLSEERHRLLLVMHHIVSDGWSMRVVAEELAALYQAFASSRPSPLPELPVQYADYAVWQREWLRAEVPASQLEYWKQQLDGARTVLELPTNRTRPAIQSGAGATHHFTLPAELTSRLTELAQGEGVTLFMLLMAAFQTLLYRYTRQEDMLVGTPVANRGRAEVESLVGLFANTLVIRARLSGSSTFREALQGVRRTALDAFAHQDLPFERLVEVLQPARDLSRSPLFQVMFALQNEPSHGLPVAGLEIEIEELEGETAKFDLLLQMAASGGVLRGRWEYNADLFERAAVERMSGHFERLLEGIVKNPDQTLSELPLLTEGERSRLLFEWGRGSVERLPEQRIEALFESQAARTPDRLAATFEGERLTYAELNERANRLALFLRARGIGPEVRVGLCVERSIEMVVGLLGILKAGGAYVPLDPQYPPERLGFMLEDGAVPVLLTQSRLVPELPPHRAEVVCLDTGWPEVAAARDAAGARGAATVDNLLYVIYTSGSTGRPKGVAMPQRPLLNLLSWRARQAEFAACDRTLQFASLSFDVACEDIFFTLLTGGTLVLVPEEVRQDLAGLAGVMEREEISHVIMSPVALQQVAQAACAASAFPSKLRSVAVSGEQLQVTDTLIRFFGELKECSLHNEYGPTETHVVTALALPDTTAAWPTYPSIGHPIDNTGIYILDGNLEPTPIGVTGDLYIGGVNLSRGYLNRPGLTAEKFIPHPFSAEPGARLYRTGDAALFLEDGRIEYQGRVDEQVKIRGFRVEPGEVEAALLRHPAVGKALALAHDDASGSKQLIAYLVAAEPLDAAELRQRLRSQLPDYMVPSAFIQVEEFPLTVNGKVDRGKLPAPAQGQLLSPHATYVAPRTPVEEKLVAIWEETLGRTQVGVTDNFFDIGGHSLRATQVVSRIAKEFQVKVRLREFIMHPTVEGLAAQLPLRAATPYAAIEPVAPQENYPLSPAQHRLWVLCRLSPRQVAYNLPAAYLLEGAIDRQAFAAAFGALVARHESLRTTFGMMDDEPRQIVHEPEDYGFALAYTDLREARDGLALAHALAKSEAETPFNLEEGPLLRVGLLQLADDRYMFLLTMHHIVSDGWSMNVMVEELLTLYRAFKGGSENPLPPPRLQYKDYAAWQSAMLRDERLEQLVDYWGRRLGGEMPVLALPPDYPRPAVQTFEGGHVRFELEQEMTAKLAELAARQQTTLFTVLFAAYNVLLHHATGQCQIILGTSVAGRNHGDLESLIGFFVNTLAIKTDVDPQLSFGELLKVVNDNLLEDFEHQDLPFDLLIQRLHVERVPSVSPVFQGRFVFNDFDYLKTLEANAASAGVRIAETFAEVAGAKFDLSVTMSLSANGLLGDMEFRTDLFKRETIERLSRQFRTLLERLVADPARRLGELGTPTAEEKEAAKNERKEKMRSALSLLKSSKPSPTR